MSGGHQVYTILKQQVGTVTAWLAPNGLNRATWLCNDTRETIFFAEVYAN